MTTTSSSPNFPAVGRIWFTGATCSGTLITPIHVLTAAHCAGTPTFFTLASPATGGTAALSVQRHPLFVDYGANKEYWNEHDTAIVTLATPITLVQPAKVFLGAAPSEFKQGRLTIFQAAAYGPSTDSVRRIGPVSDIDYIDDTDSKFIFEGNYAPNRLWSYDNEDGADTVKGDSGGAIFAVHSQQGEVLVGNVSGDYEYYVFPFSSEERNYATSLEDEIGFISSVIPNFADGDNDGVLDNFDNCPPSKCLGGNMSKCLNVDFARVQV